MGSADQDVTFSVDQPETCYILVNGVNNIGDYTLTVSQSEIGVSGITPTYYGNTQGATLRISGSGFTGQTNVFLVGNDGTAYHTSSTAVDSLYQITSTFDLTNVPVGQYTVKADAYFPNDYGLYNMSGNVSEWTSTAYYENAYSFLHDLNPDIRYDAKEDDPDAYKRKVIRGGSWKDIAYWLSPGTRRFMEQDSATATIGFRCAMIRAGSNY